MALSLFITFAITLVGATVLLVVFGHRVRRASRMAGVAYGIVLVVLGGEVSARVWDLPPGPVLSAQVLMMAAVLVVVFWRPFWNPFGQVFYGGFLAATGTYLAYAAYLTFAGGMSVVGVLASIVLLAFEVLALLLGSYFVFEGCDVICRTRSTRERPRPDPTHRPMVSIQVPAYNEPPDMLIDTIRSLEAMDYPRFEIVVIDNNTTDPEIWRPVEEYCLNRPLVKFVHVENLDGFKAGALNLVLREHTHPDAELIAVVDADYRLDPEFLEETAGYFADPNLAFLQTPQDYREWEGNTYLTSCYDAYRYFFTTSMPSRDERNAIIFAGTMGLIRRSALEEIGGWDEWCITEDAETSLRIFKRGYDGLFVPKAYGRGVMPLTFAAYKSQRFRWTFGGIQILRRHFRDLLPGRRTPENRMTIAQRFDYLMGGVLWFNDILQLGFSAVLLASLWLVATEGTLRIRPLTGAIVLLPAALIFSGVIRALWSLRVRTGISMRRAVLAFMNWLSMAWVGALAILQHLVRSEMAFLRTPKVGEERSFWNAIVAARTETGIAILLWGGALGLAAARRGSAWLIGLLAWQGLVYASAPIMSWLQVRGVLTPELERRRRSEYLRERLGRAVPIAAGAMAGASAIALAAVLAAGGSSSPEGNGRIFEPPPRDGRAQSPLGYAAERVRRGSDQPPVTTTPVPAVVEEAEPTIAPTREPTAAPTSTPAPTPTPTPTPTPAATPTPAPATAPTMAPTAAPTAATSSTPAP